MFLRSVAIKKVFFWSAMILIVVHAAQVVLVTGETLSQASALLTLSRYQLLCIPCKRGFREFPLE